MTEQNKPETVDLATCDILNVNMETGLINLKASGVLSDYITAWHNHHVVPSIFGINHDDLEEDVNDGSSRIT